jgi:hypothetical protein
MDLRAPRLLLLGMTSCAALDSWSGFDGSPEIAAIQGHALVADGKVTSLAIPFDRPQLAGDLDVIAIGWYDTSIDVKSVTDSLHNVYRVAAKRTTLGGSDILVQTIYYASGIAAASAGANIVTIEWTASTQAPDVRVAEYRGLDPVEPFDSSASNTGNDASPTSGATSTHFAHELLFGAGLVGGGDGDEYAAAGADFAVRAISSDGTLIEDRIVNEQGSYAAIAPLPRSAPWLMQLATFH